MVKFKSTIRNLLLSSLLAAPIALFAGEAEVKAANELLKVTDFEKLMDDAVETSVQVVKQMDPGMSQHEQALRTFYNKHLRSAELREEVVKIYANAFSADEIYDLITFYKTPTGKKALTKLPEIMQQSMQASQARVMDNIDELQQLLGS